MLGIELIIDGKEKCQGALAGARSNVMVIISKKIRDGREVLHCSFQGGVKGASKSHKWLDTQLAQDQIITLKFKEISENSEPVDIVDFSRVQTDQEKLQEFLALKKYLLAEKLI